MKTLGIEHSNLCFNKHFRQFDASQGREPQSEHTRREEVIAKCVLNIVTKICMKSYFKSVTCMVNKHNL